MNTHERPWIILNAAMTTDGKIDTYARKGAKISSDSDWERVDHLRAEVDAVMVGGQTLLSEDPRLTVKSPELRQKRIAAGNPENPTKVGIISNAILDTDGQFMKEGPSRVILFTTRQTPIEQIENLNHHGASVHLTGSQRVDLRQAMCMLRSEGIERVLLEGGGTLNAAMFTAGLIDEVRLYIAPLIFGGADAPTLADGIGLTREHAVQLELKSAEALPDGGVLLTYYTKNTNLN
jgi:2,5-diamino-6-(ribosylamino)-4(3H)-pyrimidinone 5'-phosphate reductase